MNSTDFKKAAYKLIDWMADYMDNLSKYPVKPNIQPGSIKAQLPDVAPTQGEGFDAIFSDFKDIIVPGMTHWQHPQFFAYFPSGASPPSILADMLSSTLGAQCMMWITSPSAEELEERTMEWLRDMLALPEKWVGVIQDSSSSGTLVSILTARETHSSYAINQRGFDGNEKFRVYTSVQGHSSVDKAVKIAGFGLDNLIKIETDENFQMLPSALEKAIEQDITMGFVPLCIISTMGTTSSGAIDPIKDIGDISKKYQCWHHIDASYAGIALLLPSMRWMSKGVELADSFVVNPHKWMLTNFDCSAYFVSDKKALIQTFNILPEYLKTPVDSKVNNYRDWGIPLGRRFRSLKLWFVIRTYGVEGLKKIIQEHIHIGKWLKDEVDISVNFELLAPVPLNLVCFRYKPDGIKDEAKLNNINIQLLEDLNQSERIFLTKTNLNDKVAIRFVSGSSNTQLEEVKKGWRTINEYASKLQVSTNFDLPKD